MTSFLSQGVFVGCILVELWRHNYLLPLLPTAMIYYGIKKLGQSLLSGKGSGWCLDALLLLGVADKLFEKGVGELLEARFKGC